jgi:hypothetical protein
MHILQQAEIKDIDDPMIKMFFHPPRETVAQANRFELWGSSFKDAGGDFTELRLIKDDATIWTGTAGGY